MSCMIMYYIMLINKFHGSQIRFSDKYHFGKHRHISILNDNSNEFE